MLTYAVKLEGFGPHPIFTNLDEAVQEAKMLLEEGGDEVVISSKEMTQEEYDLLEEFQGY